MYANNNPVIFIDPDGMDFTLIGEAAQNFVSGLQKQMDNEDWIKNKETKKMEFRVGVTAGNTPDGYEYIGVYRSETRWKWYHIISNVRWKPKLFGRIQTCYWKSLKIKYRCKNDKFKFRQWLWYRKDYVLHLLFWLSI